MIKNTVKVKPKHLEINDSFVKTFLIKDFPQSVTANLMYSITHGEHVIPGVSVICGEHFKPAEVKFDQKMKWKMDRIQRNLEAYKTKNLSDKGREEEEKALNALLYFRDGTSKGRYADFWVTVTIASNNQKAFKESVRKFKDDFEFKGFILDDLTNEQHSGLDAAWIAGGDELFKRHPGRILDLNAVGAVYPMLDGSISDAFGTYIGHRIYDNSMVYKDYKRGEDNQNQIFVGLSGEGKSTAIKGHSEGLLEEGFKLYVYDVDGEYRALCKKVKGEWVDLTEGSGKYVDPTIIERAIEEEMELGMLDKASQEVAREADMARYNEATVNTRATFSLLSENLTVKKRNALEYALMKMWGDAGIRKKDPRTWNKRDPDVGLHPLYERIKKNAKSTDSSIPFKDGAAELAEDIWSFFEGPNSDLFAQAQDSDWIRNKKLVVYHVASSVENEFDQSIGAIKIVMATGLSWQQIKRDRIKKQHYSAEVYDELQRLIRKQYAWPPLYRSVTTGRKFNDMVLMGFNDPSILFNTEGGQGIWDNTKYKFFFALERDKIEKLAGNADMPREVIEAWLNLPKYSFIYREKSSRGDLYDILRLKLPDSEFRQLSKTRGLA
ncbi:hypothetical protein [Geosporobacter ferrireducens]|uniref:TraG P-loop domain-containing protein n=1 Tax=Geosporobacter ferrireducens TaxID=1424294 RepID=A0A1D8GBS4_9FIRM|nr:hypothetical protein [Geosporobacter ferrireducens]AOT68361.1 hypothetical protein Gferi_01375 [Geosporobacter ferrireducens]